MYRFKQYVGIGEDDKKRRKRGRPRKGEVRNRKQNPPKSYKSILYESIDAITKKKKYVSISPKWQRYVQEQKEKLSSITGKSIYKTRMHDVEGVFGNIKKNLGFTQFNLREFPGVSIEWNLVCRAHNIKKLI